MLKLYLKAQDMYKKKLILYKPNTTIYTIFNLLYGFKTKGRLWAAT